VGKHLDDLSLDDTPITPDGTPPLRPGADVRDEPWFQFIDEIDDLLATGQYTWAEDTLTGIRDTVARIHQVTDGQRRAVTNIAHSDRGGYNAGSRRRYESFRRSGAW
jgi:hypothetical protein